MKMYWSSRARLISRMKRTGSLYEQSFFLEALKNDLEVFAPIGDYLPQDCIVMNRAGRVFKVQIKGTACLIKTCKGGKGRYMITASSGNDMKKSIDCQKVDILAAYVDPTDSWYLIPSLQLDNAVRISLYPHNSNSKAKHEKFLENWEVFKIS